MHRFKTDFIDQLRFNENGLIPAIAQDWIDGTVLMLAWMNRSAIEHTIKSGEVHYWSRTRQELWHKGSTSGHTQTLKGIRYDCDSDVLLITIEQTGNVACHTGERSCFFNQAEDTEPDSVLSKEPPSNICSDLFATIKSRLNSEVAGSYTKHLFNEGDNLILKKIGEESTEFVMACMENNSESIANEAADLIFHLEVALANKNVDLRRVLEILANRRGGPRRF